MGVINQPSLSMDTLDSCDSPPRHISFHAPVTVAASVAPATPAAAATTSRSRTASAADASPAVHTPVAITFSARSRTASSAEDQADSLQHTRQALPPRSPAVMSPFSGSAASSSSRRQSSANVVVSRTQSNESSSVDFTSRKDQPDTRWLQEENAKLREQIQVLARERDIANENARVVVMRAQSRRCTPCHRSSRACALVMLGAAVQAGRRDRAHARTLRQDCHDLLPNWYVMLTSCHMS